jgi:glycosyltransferase involved in cell wall biosynthesis
MTASLSRSGVRQQASKASVRKKPLSVLHLFRALYASSGGPLSFYQGLISHLDSARITTQFATVLACSPPKDLTGVQRLGRPGWPEWGNIIDFGRWLLGAIRCADVVHIHGVFSWQFVFGALFCRLRRVPYMVRPHGSLSEQFLAIGPWRKRLYLELVGKPLLRRAFTVMAMTPDEAKFINKLDPSLPVRILMPGLEMPSMLASPEHNGPLRVVFLGRVAEVKRLPDILEALGRLKKSGMAIHLDVIGSGKPEYVASMKQKADQCGIGPCVIFHGFLQGETKRKVMCRAHVLALPSRGENFSFATAESLSMGLPAVITDRVGLAPYVKQSGGGQVIALGDITALARSLAIYRDPTAWQSASQCARAWALENLDSSVMVSKLTSLYEEAANSVYAARRTDG